VVGVLDLSPRRRAVLGVLKEEGAGGALFLVPRDPRLPRMVTKASSLPPAQQAALKAEAALCDAQRTIVCAVVVEWEAGFIFPLAQVGSSLGRPGILRQSRV
jgi:Dis3-like cold-shock domain 2 (CSD2)